jgi:hypothetical protein
MRFAILSPGEAPACAPQAAPVMPLPEPYSRLRAAAANTAMHFNMCMRRFAGPRSTVLGKLLPVTIMARDSFDNRVSGGVLSDEVGPAVVPVGRVRACIIAPAASHI